MAYGPDHNWLAPGTNPTVSPTVTVVRDNTEVWQHESDQWFKPTPCSCEYAGMHTWLGHWFRLLWTRRTW